MILLATSTSSKISDDRVESDDHKCLLWARKNEPQSNGSTTEFEDKLYGDNYLKFTAFFTYIHIDVRRHANRRSRVRRRSKKKLEEYDEEEEKEEEEWS